LVIPFNNKMKERFLGDMNLSEETKYYYNRLFLKSKFAEETLNKDLAYFNVIELETVLYSLKSATLNACIKEAGIIKTYINWALEKGLRQDGVNPVLMLKEDDYRKFIPDKNINFTYNDVFDVMIPPVYNASDAICILLPFEGLSLAEMVNLTKYDVDWNNRVLIVQKDRNDERTKRVVQVEQKTIDLIAKSIEESEYYKKNGYYRFNPTPRVKPTLELASNDFIVRAAQTYGDNENAPADTQTVTRRLKMLKEELDQPELKFQNLSRSGLLWYAKKLMDEREGRLDTEAYKMIGKKFDVEPTYAQLRRTVNEEEVNKLYNRR